ncbi:MAG: hypothetical protein JO202_19410 [Ktedonobacteraceae bacterium]|nr:hypothetical protein [Ktedonobacteraceae bacterium]
MNQQTAALSLDELLTVKHATPRPKIVCLCGSTRFAQAFEQATLSETLAGRVVLSIGCNTASDDDLVQAGLALNKDTLDVLHLFKIDLADDILVLNVGGYVGESTRREIAYAKQQGKGVRYLQPPERTKN